MLGAAALLGGASCSGTTEVPIAVTLSPGGVQTVVVGQSRTFTATVVGDASDAGVSWAFQGPGTLSAETTTSVTYQAPGAAAANESATLTATSRALPSAQASARLLLSLSANIGVTISPSVGLSLEAGQTLAFSATVANDPDSQGVTWSLSGVGSLAGPTASAVTYAAPASVSSRQVVTLTATANDGGGTSASVSIAVVAAGTSNTAPVVIDTYDDVLFVTVTVCVPGTSQCDTIDHVQVDTGSVGLRVLSSANGGKQSVPLPRVTVGGRTIQNCVSFVDLSYLWGDVASADVTIGEEFASAVPIQVAETPTDYTVPSQCSSGGVGADNISVLAANGILGIGTEPTDCTLQGTNYCTATPPPALYWACSPSGCPLAQVDPSKQVTNPVVLFPQDNNGTLIDLPAVNHVATTLSGSLIFGIGTHANNALGSASLYTLDATGMFTTSFSGQTLPSSYLDSGTNGLFFPSSLRVCSGQLSDFYCPGSSQSLSAQNQGSTQGSGTVAFTIDDASMTFNNQDSVYSGIGGPNASYPCTGSACSFAWGMPFFLGRPVFTAIDGQTVPGVQVPTPWWAY